MENQEIKKLPFWDTVARSFKYVLKNKALLKGILPLAAALIVLQIFIGLPFLCSIDTSACSNDWRQTVTILSVALGAVGVIINYCRAIVCKAEVDFISLRFWKQTGLYFVASLFLSLLVAVPVIICLTLSAFIFDPQTSINLLTSISLLASVASAIVFAPLFLILPAIAAEDYQMIRWSKLFAMAKGNHNAIFWAQFIIMIPYWLIAKMWSEIYGFIASDNYVISLIFVAGGLVLGILDASFKGAFFAHIYQFFKFYDKKK